MRNVRLNKDELLKVVRQNKEKHVAAYQEAVEDYKVAAVKLALNNLKLARTGELAKMAKTRSLPAAPMSYEDNYTQAIAMLEMSVDDVIELEAMIFNQLVLDKWDWKSRFAESAMLYKSMT